MNKSIYLDIETTGFSRQWDTIIELAAIVVDEDSHTIIDEFHEYIKPGKKIPANIVNLTGISDATVVNCRAEMPVLMDFVEWFQGHNPNRVIGHNCKVFDLGFIGEKCVKYNLGWRPNFEIVDTLVLARQLNKAGKIAVPNCQQKTIANYFNIEYEAHSAIEDIRALIQIYEKMKNFTQPTTRESLGF